MGSGLGHHLRHQNHRVWVAGRGVHHRPLAEVVLEAVLLVGVLEEDAVEGVIGDEEFLEEGVLAEGFRHCL